MAFQALSPQYHRKLPGLQNTFTLKISTATYTGKPGISGAEAGGLPVQGQPGLPRETLSPKKPKATQTVVITPWRRACLLCCGVSNALQRVYCFIVFSFPLYSELWASLTSANDGKCLTQRLRNLSSQQALARGRLITVKIY